MRGRGEEGQIGPPFIANNGASVAVIGSGVPQVAVYLSADLRLPRRMTIEAEKDTSSSPLMATLQREREREWLQKAFLGASGRAQSALH